MKQISILILAAMLATACQKENTSPKAPANATLTNGTSNLPAESPGVLDGTYTGYFSLATTGVQTSKLPVRLVIAGNQFNSGDLSNTYYSVGAGTLAPGTGVLSFTNIDAFPDYMLAGSNIPLSSIGLSNNYNFSIKGDSLLLSKTLQGTTYTYALAKH